MGKLDKATERAFENEIGEAYEDLKFARNRLVKRYMQKVEDDMEVKRDEFARLLLSARDKGMSVAAIGRGMGTSSRNTIYQYFERAEQRGIMGAGVDPADAIIEAAQPFEVLETLAWNDIPYVRKMLATGVDGAVGAARLVVSRTDESVKGWVTSVDCWGTRKFGFAEDKDGPGNWWGGRGAFRLRENSQAATSWDGLAEQQTGQVRELVLWVAENITDWGE